MWWTINKHTMYVSLVYLCVCIHLTYYTIINVILGWETLATGMYLFAFWHTAQAPTTEPVWSYLSWGAICRRMVERWHFQLDQLMQVFRRPRYLLRCVHLEISACVDASHPHVRNPTLLHYPWSLGSLSTIFLYSHLWFIVYIMWSVFSTSSHSMSI